MMVENENIKLEFVFNEAYQFLRKYVDEDSLEAQFEYYHQCKPSSLNKIFWTMISSLKNKQGYTNFIADTNEMNEILFDFNPQEVINNYNSWNSLFNEFELKFGKIYKMNIENPRNAWVMYSKGVISCANFLINFRSADDFDKFVELFSYNEFTSAALPMLLDKEIYGYGFALSCDFLKESGYVSYGKPDIHLKDIFVGIGISTSSDDYEVFKTIIKMGSVVGVEPVIIDKLFWLIGSGKFDINRDFKIGRHKKEFIELINKKLNQNNISYDESRIGMN